jgi:phage tail sheath protein FI
MSTLSISSPGVQINEVDLSIISRPLGATDVLVTGFAPQGPTETLINVGSVSEFESIFGTPTSAAERYLYYTSRQILSQSPANLYVVRLPYGPGLGSGYGNSYSALVYPISSNAQPSTNVYGITAVTVTQGGSAYNFAPSVQFVGGGLSGVEVADPAQGYAVIYDSSYLSNQTLSAHVGQVSGIVITHYGSGYLTNPQVVLAGGNFATVAQAVVNNIYVVGQTSSDYSDATAYALGEPVSLVLNDDQYYDLISNNIPWEQSFINTPIQTFDDIKYAGLVVINDSKAINDNLFEGYYLAISDNKNINPATNFNSVTAINAVTGQSNSLTALQTTVPIPSARLAFTLQQNASSFALDSLSKVIEQFPISFDFGLPAYNDSLTLTLFKLNGTQYGQDTVTLNYSVVESYVGSLNASRTQNNPKGGNPVSFFLETVVNNASNNLKIAVNPFISSTGSWTQNNGLPAKNVFVSDSSKAAYATGVYSDVTGFAGQDIGNVSNKLSRVLSNLSNDETTNIDVIVDGGLSTIWATAYAQAKQSGVYNSDPDSFTFDETYTPTDIDNTGGIGNTTVNVIPQGETYIGYQDITQQFVDYAEARKDHVFISDPLRQIFVRGQNAIVSQRKSYNFTTQTYWPLNNIYSGIQSSYVATYGNWIQTNDIWSTKPAWVPVSGYVGAIIAQSSQSTYPWIAPAGFNRGTLLNVLNLGINPTQKQRDQLYKININPIAFFNTDGFVVMGQKTMYRKPSAFDRINVRRLFLTLEKETQKLLKYYVFEPNDFATRNRLVASLTPIFDQAKLNDGCYDYLIVCDTTNNTPAVIDNNELKISIYIQPVRAAEFILADFIATRTGVNFSELISGGQS